MDTDVILVHPVDSLRANVVAWQDNKRQAVNNAIMIFEKGNLFLKSCLEEFAENYNIGLWSTNGPGLLTRVLRHWNHSNDAVYVLEKHSFYMFSYDKIKKQCFSEIAGNTFDSNMKVLKEKAYAVHLNSKITGKEGMMTEKLKEGTICKYLLNSYCVLCNKQY